MDGKHYKLSILPLFEDDLNEIVDYLCIRLQNPIAAEDFVAAVETAIRERLSCAEAFSRIIPKESADILITAFR